MKTPEFRHYPGYVGMHVRDQAEGAIPNKTRVMKVKEEPGDPHPAGSLGTVLGSIEAPPPIAEKFNEKYMYFVEFDSDPGIAIGIQGNKIGPVN